MRMRMRVTGLSLIVAAAFPRDPVRQYLSYAAMYENRAIIHPSSISASYRSSASVARVRIHDLPLPGQFEEGIAEVAGDIGRRHRHFTSVGLGEVAGEAV